MENDPKNINNNNNNKNPKNRIKIIIKTVEFLPTESVVQVTKKEEMVELQQSNSVENVVKISAPPPQIFFEPK